MKKYRPIGCDPDDRFSYEDWMNETAAREGDQAMSDIEIDRLRARIAELEPFKAAVIDALISGCIYQQEHETNAAKALSDLLSWETTIALDPEVSSDAQALIDRGRREAPKP